MAKITGNEQGQKVAYKPPVNTGLREVRVVTVIQTLNCVGTGVEGDPVRTERQYWTEEGEQITSTPKRYDHFLWLELWVDAYEKSVEDGKATEFYAWVNSQPMSAG